jgi:PAS domain S-box-containing protein
MKKLIKILFVETIQDIENLLNIISSEGTTNTYKVVSSRKEFIDNLIAYCPDIIVTDYEYSGLSIHDILQIRHEMSPYTPIILITDQKNEKEAVRYITNGSDDYVVKSHLSRLPYTLDTCLAKHNALSFRLNAENELRNMKEQVEMLKRTVKDISIALVAVDKYHSIKIWNRPSEEMLGWTQKEVIGLPYRNFIKIEYIGFDNQKVLTSLHDNGYWNGDAFIWNKKNQKLLMFCRLSALNRDNPDNGEILFEFHKLPNIPKHGTINKTSLEDADKTIILDNYTSEVKE